jgi:hypothetical protein
LSLFTLNNAFWIALGYDQLCGAQDELNRQQQAQQRNGSVVSEREITALQVNVDSRKGALEAALASRFVIKSRIDSVLPIKVLVFPG